jgi:hypothetical protein
MRDAHAIGEPLPPGVVLEHDLFRLKPQSSFPSAGLTCGSTSLFANVGEKDGSSPAGATQSGSAQTDKALMKKPFKMEELAAALEAAAREAGGVAGTHNVISLRRARH